MNSLQFQIQEKQRVQVINFKQVTSRNKLNASTIQRPLKQKKQDKLNQDSSDSQQLSSDSIVADQTKVPPDIMKSPLQSLSHAVSKFAPQQARFLKRLKTGEDFDELTKTTDQQQPSVIDHQRPQGAFQRGIRKKLTSIFKGASNQKKPQISLFKQTSKHPMPIIEESPEANSFQNLQNIQKQPSLPILQDAIIRSTSSIHKEQQQQQQQQDSSVKEQHITTNQQEQLSAIEESLSSNDDSFNENEFSQDEYLSGQRLKPNKWFLTLQQNNKDLVFEYENNVFERFARYQNHLLISLNVVQIIKTFVLMLVRDMFEQWIIIIILRFAANIAFFVIIIFQNSLQKKDWVKYSLYGCLSYSLVVILGESLLYKNYVTGIYLNFSFTELIVAFFFFSILPLMSFLATMILFLVSLCLWYSCLAYNWKHCTTEDYQVCPELTLDNSFYPCAIALLLGFKAYLRNKGYINNFNNLRIQDLKMMQHNNLVKYLLPTHVYIFNKFIIIVKLLERMFGNPQMISELTEEYQEATILFADIAGYTKYSKGQDAETVVNTLRKLYTEFDKLCLKHNVYKVYTIGDCYVVLGIIDANQRDPSQEAKNVIDMGFSMIDVIRNIRAEINFSELDMRIGIHTGDIIGGITGTNIVRYDIYGINVTIANKMESNGKVGHVHVSNDTKNTVEIKFPDYYEFVENAEGPLKLPTMDVNIESFFVNTKSLEEQFDFFFDNIDQNGNQEE